MKVTLNWLKEYVEFAWAPEELAERLTMLGLEVEGMQQIGGEFAGIVVAQILASEKHPNADKLSVCRVTDGQAERQIVCGATNYKVGDKVPLILPGCSLPAQPGQPPVTIKAGKIRGIESQGMMCSPKELGLAEDAAGLLILPGDAKIGQPFAEHLGRASSDTVFDLEITPNRPDLNSVIGIAREISAVTGHPLRLPDVSLNSSANAPSEAAQLEIKLEDPELCARYVARLIRGVKIASSPDWLRQVLEKAGLRSINNVVDVTNFVMLETGQPLHAFDYHLLTPASGRTHPSIVVRRAAEGERFVTLDGQERTLTSQMLLIADETKAIALAGIMGGQNTEIHQATRDVLLESAYFIPRNIRATSKKLELRTESSYRFERGADIIMADWASCRAAQLILQTAGGELSPKTWDAYPKPFAAREIALRHAKVDALLGVSVPVADQVNYLSRLGLELTTSGTDGSPAGSAAGNQDSSRFRIPSFRVDLKRETDLIEEVGRLFGVDGIPSTPPRGAIGANTHDAVHDQLFEARRILSGLGLNEAQGQTLISDAAAKSFRRGDAQDWVELENPLSSDMDVLRPSLLPGLLDAMRRNLHHKTGDVALFEIGRAFNTAEGQPSQTRRLALTLTGHRFAAFWSGGERSAKFDIYDLKGLIEEFLEQFGVRGVTFVRHAEARGIFLESASIHLGKLALGEIGQLQPAMAKAYDLRDPVLLAELDLDQLLLRRNVSKSFRALPAFPSVRRDVAMLVPELTTHDAVLAAAKQAKAQNLETIELFDVFRGQNIPAGQKSVAYAFTYRHPERTLTDAEVNATHEKLIEQFRQRLNATIR